MMTYFFSLLFFFSSVLFGSEEPDFEISTEGENLISSFRDFLMETCSEETVHQYFLDIKTIAEKTNNLENLKQILKDKDTEKQKQNFLNYAIRLNHRNIVLYLFLKEKAFIPAQFLKKERSYQIDIKKKASSLTLPIDSLIDQLKRYGIYSKKQVWGWEFSEKRDPLEIFSLYKER